jgi:O-antigen ligase
MSAVHAERQLSRSLVWWLIVVASAAVAGALVPSHPLAAAGFAAIGCAITALSASRMRPLREVLVLSAILIAGLVDWPRSVHLGSITGSGVLTIVAAALLPLGWWLAPRGATKSVPIPLVMVGGFVSWVVLSFAYHAPSAAGLQNVLVWIAYLGIIGTTIVTVRLRGAFAGDMMVAIAVSSVAALLLYSGSVARGGLDSHAVIDPRGFALFALVPVGCGLAWYRSGNRAGLLVSGAATVLILLSLSRLAFVTALVLWGIATLDPSHARGRIRFVLGALLAATATYAAITYIKPLHQRFYRGQIVQVSTGVPGVSGFNVNLEGRLQLWSTTWSSYKASPIIGHGAGASDDLITRDFGAGAGHPHDDYLRLLNDYGAVGFVLWMISYAICLGATYRKWTLSLRAEADNVSLYHLSAFLALLSVGLGMITDNVMIYLPIMLPVGALLGISLALPSRLAATPALDGASARLVPVERA